MEIRVYPIFEKDFNFTQESSGEFLGKHYEELEDIAEKLDIEPLSFFDSINHNEEMMKAFENYEGDTDPQEIIDAIPHTESWFEPAEGIETMDALIEYLQKDSFKNKEMAKGVIEDLADLKNILELALKKDIGFQLKME